MKKLKYYVHLDRFVKRNSGMANFAVFDTPRAAMRCFKRNPVYGQIDVRGIDGRGRHVRECWKYWNRGKIVTQSF